ncbi:F-box protein of unknown function [Batrachochytrium dendrobatidis]|nr:F-box protein of unknown function [Batrachochytrium dendrobatidis]KAK5671973.1 F-box protein of unknown function [Batrachochytrium dendrobatidis]
MKVSVGHVSKRICQRSLQNKTSINPTASAHGRHHRVFREPHIDFLKLLSNELVVHIFLCLEVEDIIRLSQVATHWRCMAYDRIIWRTLFITRFLRPSISSQTHSNHLVRYEQTKDIPLPTGSGYYWFRLYRINHNWVTGSYSSKRIDVGTSSLMHSLPLTRALVAMGENWLFYPDWHEHLTHTGRICCLNLSTFQNGPWFELNSVLPTCTASISILKIVKPSPVQSGLFVGLTDGSWLLLDIDGFGTLSVLSKYTATCSLKVQDCSASIVTVSVLDKVVCTCSENSKIGLFSLNSGLMARHIASLTGIRGPCPIDLHLSLSNSDGSFTTPRTFLLSIASGSSIFGGGWEPYIQQVFFTETAIVSSCQLLPSYATIDSYKSNSSRSDGHCIHHALLSDAAKSSLLGLYWNPFTMAMEPVVHSYAPICLISLFPPFVVCAHMDNSIQIYTLTSSEQATTCIRCTSKSDKKQFILRHSKTLFGHTSRVTAMVLVRGRLITCAMDGIKIWEFPDVNMHRLVYALPFSNSIPTLSAISDIDIEDTKAEFPNMPIVTLMDKASRAEFLKNVGVMGTVTSWVGVDHTKIVLHETTSILNFSAECSNRSTTNSRQVGQQHTIRVVSFL